MRMRRVDIITTQSAISSKQQELSLVRTNLLEIRSENKKMIDINLEMEEKLDKLKLQMQLKESEEKKLRTKEEELTKKHTKSLKGSMLKSSMVSRDSSRLSTEYGTSSYSKADEL